MSDPAQGKDALLSRVTLGYLIGVLGPIIDPTLRACCDTDLGSMEPVIWALLVGVGYGVAMIGRARAQRRITSVAGVPI